MEYRQLYTQEIQSLEKQGCYCADWSTVSVVQEFNPEFIHQVRFGAYVKLGAFGSQVEAGGIVRFSGLFNSQISHCDIGNNVYISQVGFLEGYTIAEGVIIENVSSMVVDGETSFGLGTSVEVLNEGGGREVPLFDRLSAQLADLMVRYRHEPKMIETLENLIGQYVQKFRASQGKISSGSIIRDSRTIRNINIGPSTRISGANLLEEGTIASSNEDPVIVGAGVVAKNFVMLSGAHIESGAIIEKCLVGQGARLGKQFSGENCLFFANCEAFHGEGVSLFAGPYTVTHHKSTLLIAAMISFYNAGSGTNQSNHMYKLGPFHQGLLERGSKTGSFSYLLWPCRVGAFSVVMDKHGSTFDTSCFPFSYITLEAGKSMITPAMNLFTVGTKRDADKWPTRDRRNDPDKMDLINFDLLSPYVVGKMIKGSAVLQDLAEITPMQQKVVNYQGIGIKRLLLKACRKYYQIGIKKYFGEQLIERLNDSSFNNLKELRLILGARGNAQSTEWVDLAGMLAPSSAIDDLISDLKDGAMEEIGDVLTRFEQIHNSYSEFSWNWYREVVNSQLDIDLDIVTVQELISIINDWQTNSHKLNNMILKDAEKEFDPNSKIGFGVDGVADSKDLDFVAVRGNYEENSFVIGLKQENEEVDRVAQVLVDQLKTLEQIDN